MRRSGPSCGTWRGGWRGRGTTQCPRAARTASAAAPGHALDGGRRHVAGLQHHVEADPALAGLAAAARHVPQLVCEENILKYTFNVVASTIHK